MGKLVKNFKNTYYEKDDGLKIYFNIPAKYITSEMVENLIDGKVATFQRKSLFGYSEISVKLTTKTSKFGNLYGAIEEDKEIATFDDRPIVKGALNRLISDDFLDVSEYTKHIKGVLNSLSLIKEYFVMVDTVVSPIETDDKFVRFVIYRNYNNLEGKENEDLQVTNVYLRYSNDKLVGECTKEEFAKNKSEYKVKNDEIKAKAAEERLQRNIENLKAHRKDFILPTITSQYKYSYDLNVIFKDIFEGRTTKSVNVKITSYLDNINDERIISLYCKTKNEYVAIEIPYLDTIYLEYDENGNLIGEITQTEYDKAVQSIESEIAEYYSDKNEVLKVRRGLFRDYCNKGLEELVRDVNINNALDFSYFDIFQRGLVKKQGERAAVEHICDNIFVESLDATSLKEDLLNVLKIYYEFNNISEKNIASLAPFIINNNLKKYYDDMLLYDEAIEPIIKTSKDKKLLSRVLKKIAGTSLAATYADRNSTFYFERKVRAKNIVMNPVQLLNDLVALIPEYNDRSDVVVLFNIILNADESFTYQFYTFAEDESGGDMDGRRVGNMTRIYNRHHKTPIAFEYE